MNITNSTATNAYDTYGLPAMVVMPFAPLVLCPLLSAFTYMVAKRRLTSVSETSSGAFVFYRALSGSIFGEFVSRIIYLCSPWLAIFCAVGYTLFNIAESVAYVWTTNENYISVGDEMPHEDVGLDKENIVHNPVIVINEINSEKTQKILTITEDLWKIEAKRMWMMASMFVVFTVISITDGLLLIYYPPTALWHVVASVISYYLTCATFSSTLYGSMLHARIHTNPSKAWRLGLWISLSGLWCIVLSACLIPFLLGLTRAEIAPIVENQAVLAFFGISLGILLKQHVYFHSLRTSTRISKPNHFWAELGFSFSAAQSILSSFLL